MNLNQRQLILVKMLLENETYSTTEEYADKLLVTSRTIKSDIEILRDELKRYGVVIQSKRGKGIVLKVNDQEQFKQLKTELSKVVYNFGSFRNEYQQRAFLIYRIIVNRPSWFTVDDLANEMKLSRSVINQEMPEVRNRLKRFGLSLEISTSNGLRLCGSEISIRAAIIDSFESFNEDQTTEYYLEEFKDIDFIKTVTVRKEISECLKKHDIGATSILIDRMTVAFFVTVIRNQIGKSVDNHQLDLLHDSKMYEVILEILQESGISLPEKEVEFLAMYCLNFSFPNNLNELEDYYCDFFQSAKSVFESFSQYLKKEWKMEIADEIYQKRLIALLLQNLLASEYMLNSMYFTNSISKYARSSYLLFDIAYRSSLYLTESHNYIFSRRLIYSLTLFYDLYFGNETKIDFSNVKIKIVPNYDIMSGDIYKKYIVSKIPQLFNNTLVTERYDSKENDVLYVVIDNEFIHGNNVIHVDYLLDEKEFYNELIEKIIEVYYVCPNSFIELTKNNIVEMNHEISKKELFMLISGIYSDSLKNQFETVHFLNQRETTITYGNQKNYLAIIPLFDQEKTGANLIRLEKPILFRNWMTKDVLTISLKKNTKQIELMSKVIKIIMKDYDAFIDLLNNLGMEEDLFKLLIKKSMNY